MADLILFQFLDLNQTCKHSKWFSKADLRTHYNMIIFHKLRCSLSWRACNSQALESELSQLFWELFLHVGEELNKPQSFPKNHQHTQMFYVVTTTTKSNMALGEKKKKKQKPQHFSSFCSMRKVSSEKI